MFYQLKRTLQFESISIFIIIIIIFLILFPKNYGFLIILIVFAGFLTTFFIEQQLTTRDNFNHETKIKLNNLYQIVYNLSKKKEQSINYFNHSEWISQRLPKYLYLDATMIHFLDSIKDLAKWSDVNFVELLFHTNKLLHLQYMIIRSGSIPENIFEIYDTAILVKRDCINTMHNFIYQVPKLNKMYTYVDDITSRYIVLINRNLDEIKAKRDEYIKIKGVNVNTHFNNHNKTAPYDPMDKFNYY